MKRKICLITSGQPSVNPRLVKEADALVKADYEVVVLYVFYTRWADKADQFICAHKNFELVMVGGSPTRKKLLYFYTRIRLKIAEAIFRLGLNKEINHALVSRATPELIKQATKINAELYIAHNLGALPAAVVASKRNNAKVIFDAEDFHSEELLDNLEHKALVEGIERKYLSKCHYITAASEPIAQAYVEKYGIPLPTAILNVFPLQFLQELPRPLGPDLSLYWFSQTIGLDRGLQDVIQAMGKIKENIHLYLQGQVSEKSRAQLAAVAKENHILGDKIHFIEPTNPDDIFKIAAQFDVGLALEQKKPLNRDVCLTNKIFTYLLSGLSVIATETQGQKPVVESIGKGGWIYKAGDIQSLASRLEFLCNNKEELKNSKLEVLKHAKERYNWDIEKEKFLRIINSVLSK